MARFRASVVVIVSLAAATPGAQAGATAGSVVGPVGTVVGGLVGGMLADGMRWSLDADGGGPLVITKAGGFGGPDALVALFSPRGA